MNSLHLTDGYKIDHRNQYPENTQFVYSNWTPRSSRVSEIEEVVFFGLQYFIKKYLIEEFNDTFFNQPKEQVVQKYKRRISYYLGPNAITYEHIEALYDLGFLPIEIKALPEGTKVPIRLPMFTIKNTIPDFFWLTNFLETILSCVIWMPCTSATIASHYKQILVDAAKLTGGDLEFVNLQGHDFSFRGMAGLEAAMMSGAGHLLSFVGTDTIPAIDFLEHYYNANAENETIGISVPATEHSVMCMGTEDHEIGTFSRLISEVYPKGIVSIVSDTWDFWKVIDEYLPKLKEDILKREGKVVIRPDSGDPVKIICGDPDAPVNSSAYKGAVERLFEIFGGSHTSKGFKLLDDHIGLIYGDSITLERCKLICERLIAKGFASTNVVFGIGSYTYQYVTRDTFGFAMKATYGVVEGVGRPIFKDPKTDDGIKKSAKGLLRIEQKDGKLKMEEMVSQEDEKSGLLKTVFIDGKLILETSLAAIRARVSSREITKSTQIV